MAEPGQNPFETPRPRGIRLMQGALRVVVALQCFGIAAAHLHQHRPDLFCELMGKSRDLPADQISNIADIVSYALIVCGVLSLLRPATLILLPVIVYQSGTAAAALLQSEAPFSYLEPAIQATRIAVPLALLLVDFWPPRIKPTLVMCLSATALLRLATAVTFISQGFVCLEQSWRGGAVLELVHEALRHSFHDSVNLDQARRCLALAGAVEIGIAMALMTSRSRLAMAGCVVVGLISAAIFTLADGPTGYSQTLIRVSQGGAPLAVLLFHLTSVKELPPIYLAEIKKPAPAAPPDKTGKKR